MICCFCDEEVTLQLLFSTQPNFGKNTLENNIIFVITMLSFLHAFLSWTFSPSSRPLTNKLHQSSMPHGETPLPSKRLHRQSVQTLDKTEENFSTVAGYTTESQKRRKLCFLRTSSKTVALWIDQIEAIVESSPS